MMARPSRLDVMEKGDVPCLWILGTMDNYIDYNKMKMRVNLPTGSSAEVLEDSGHLGFIEEKDKSLSLIKSFADSVFR
jgi:pimeloyl-ACP methyl ester carboxylesterase